MQTTCQIYWPMVQTISRTFSPAPLLLPWPKPLSLLTPSSPWCSTLPVHAPVFSSQSVPSKTGTLSSKPCVNFPFDSELVEILQMVEGASRAGPFHTCPITCPAPLAPLPLGLPAIPQAWPHLRWDVVWEVSTWSCVLISCTSSWKCHLLNNIKKFYHHIGQSPFSSNWFFSWVAQNSLRRCKCICSTKCCVRTFNCNELL